MSRAEGRTIGLLHPGAMGASVGAAAALSNRVLWCPTGRSVATKERAETAGLEAVGFGELCASSDVILSICPPSESSAVAASVSNTGFSGVYVDGNAVSAEQSRSVASTFVEGQVDYVDGGIIGPPARSAGTTRLYLSGRRAPDIASLFEGSPLAAIAIEGEPEAASSLKMCFAAWTKGSSALLLAIRAVAEGEGVADELLAEWQISQPDLASRSERTAAGVAPKAWRFAGEMHEIADTFSSVGLPDGFFRSAADLYERLDSCKDQLDPPVRVDDVVRLLLARAGGETT